MIECNLTADQWQLFADTYEIPDDAEVTYNQATPVAEALNAAFNDAVNRGCAAAEVHKIMHDLMWDSDCGASDTEPRQVFECLLLDAFGAEGEKVLKERVEEFRAQIRADYAARREYVLDEATKPRARKAAEAGLPFNTPASVWSN
jgi:hypothetical protein